MPTLKHPETASNIAKKIADGRGAGEGREYKPWLYTHEVPSMGLSHNPFSYKLGREMHLLSTGEQKFFYVAEYSPKITDVREQYPLLPLEETIQIARDNNILHPKDPRSQSEKVITTDFLLTTTDGGSIAIAFKYARPLQAEKTLSSNTLEDLRTLEKLEIERLFWKARNIPWRIFTEIDIPENVYKNIKQFYAHYQIEDNLKTILRDVATYIAMEITNKPQLPLREITAASDRRFAITPGSSLAIVWHLLAHRKWEIDLQKLVNPDKPLLLSFSSPKFEEL